MKTKDILLIATGVGILYMLSRSSSSSFVPSPYPVSSTGGSSSGGVIGGLFDSIANLFRGFPTTVSNPGINPVTNPNLYSNNPPDYGTFANDSGDPCDPSSVQYNPEICNEL